LNKPFSHKRRNHPIGQSLSILLERWCSDSPKERPVRVAGEEKCRLNIKLLSLDTYLTGTIDCAGADTPYQNMKKKISHAQASENTAKPTSRQYNGNFSKSMNHPLRLTKRLGFGGSKEWPRRVTYRVTVQNKSNVRGPEDLTRMLKEGGLYALQID
jgi:hypothetical protein